MKYIRTKDGVERASYGEEFHEGKSYFYKTEYQWLYGDTYHKVKTKTYAKNGTTKIADNIGELCDGDVLFEDGQLKKVHYYKEGYCFNQYGSKLSANQQVVLFIATDKGLIFVAKMNEKGELELL